MDEIALGYEGIGKPEPLKENLVKGIIRTYKKASIHIGVFYFVHTEPFAVVKYNIIL